MQERDKILERIREALRASSAAGAQPHTGLNVASTALAGGQTRRWLPAVSETLDERLALFEKNAVELKTDFRVLNTWDEAWSGLGRLRDTEGWKRVAAHEGDLTDTACHNLGLPVCWTDHGYAVNELESCDVGITQCDALIAQTGSVLVTSHSSGGRALSVLPPHHVLLARREQLVPDLTEAFAVLKQKYQNNYPSFISFITGPSRTGDIERVLVLGAHGPRKLTIFCV